ncbi:MAG TPA: OmpH family outer membrane protein [Niabella sp.]|nr:OmpH family outer membrane protein [Niabella sp.]HOZ98313.1 OmpH family outer membrane protein [Niabella sp.]HQW13392.1 OmpH family outer membrane protein [Niabella sp.]HQX18786.1 OmpH family outer membrane protein [Niabella sp.]HQX42660.1 OmpH family outer membrane protein [Niabella sp.]
MKKLIVCSLAVLFISLGAFAQRYALVDTRYVFEQMPDYKNVQKLVDAQAATWQKEIDIKQEVLDKLYKDYDAEGAMMSEDLKRKKENELYVKEKELRDLQKKRFGFEGDLFKKRVELMEPLQKKISEAIQRLATANGYDLVLDKSEGKTIIFADPKLDKSNELLKELRLK